MAWDPAQVAVLGQPEPAPHAAPADDPASARYAWGPAVVDQVFALILRDPTFYMRARRAILPEYFPDRAQREVMRAAATYVDRYGRAPTEPILRVLVAERAAGDLQREQLWQGAVDRAMACQVTDAGWIRDRVVEFGRAQAMRAAWTKGLDLLEQGKVDEAAAGVVKASAVGRTMLDPGNFYIRDRVARMERRMLPRTGMPTGYQFLDSCLDGGAQPGELYCTVGGSKAGKTFLLVNLAYHACRLGHRVVYYTMEVSAQKIEDRLDCRALGVAKDYLRGNVHKVRNLMEAAVHAELGAGEIVVKQFPTGAATVSDLEANLEVLADAYGFRADLLIVDYVDLLAVEDRYDKEYAGIVANTVGLRRIAIERTVPVWTASQFTKEGAMRAVGRKTDVAGAYGKVATVDGLFGLSATQEEEQQGMQRLSALAVRNAAGGRSVLLRHDWDTARVDPVSESYAYGTPPMPPHLQAPPVGPAAAVALQAPHLTVVPPSGGAS